MTHPERKPTRIPGYDYATPNYYFITICTHNKQCLFGSVEQLNGCGQIARDLLLEIPKHYPTVSIDKFVVMPNHIHAIIILRESPESCGKSLPVIIAQYKSAVSKTIGKPSPIGKSGKNPILTVSFETIKATGMHGNTSTRIPFAGISTVDWQSRILSKCRERALTVLQKTFRVGLGWTNSYTVPFRRDILEI